MDYITLTKQYLQRYPWLKYYVQHLSEQVQDTYETATQMVAQYGEHIGHSSVKKLHPGAKLAENISFNIVKEDLTEAVRDVKRIEELIEMLPRAERRIIELRYFERSPMPWEAVAREVRFERTYCLDLHNKAIKNMSLALFGPKAG